MLSNYGRLSVVRGVRLPTLVLGGVTKGRCKKWGRLYFFPTRLYSGVQIKISSQTDGCMFVDFKDSNGVNHVLFFSTDLTVQHVKLWATQEFTPPPLSKWVLWYFRSFVLIKL